MTPFLPERAPSGNGFLDRLSDADYRRLHPHLRRIPLRADRSVYEEWQPMSVLYFPINAVTSTLVVTADGHAIEVANVGREGIVGVGAVLGLQPSIHKVIVQIGGEGLRIDLAEFRAAVEPEGSLRRAVLRYYTAFLAQCSQSVACNGLHQIQQRCCRWLLMTHDRIGSDELPLTHEFLGIMLGVRRASISEVLKQMQDDGLINNDTRGRIVITDRLGLEAACCECYGKIKEEYKRMLGSDLT